MWQNTLAQFINIDGSNKEYCWRTKIKLVAQKIGNNQIHFNNKLDYICSSIEEYCDCHCDAMYCTTNDKSNPNRKPNIGMLLSFKETYFDDVSDYVKSASLMIGDASGKEGQFSDSDKKTAENFGIDYMDVEEFVNINLED